MNSFIFKKQKSRSAFTVNDDIGIYLKYANEPHGSYNEYKFTFTREHLDELEALQARRSTVIVALVCVDAKEICALPLPALQRLVKKRKAAAGIHEGYY